MKMMLGERRFARLFQRPGKLFGLFDQKMLQLDDFGQILSRFEHRFHLIGLRPKANCSPLNGRAGQLLSCIKARPSQEINAIN
ncbi:hypothetical protein [Methylocella tundrae]|uniref:hypothetical protein n=1 Tax=Methylocella tundrae TaxID=227605 RepID=UPI00157AF505|nr:hypothetical protein [Methylocella tundrae]